MRAAEIAPRLKGIAPCAGKVLRVEERIIDVAWTLGDGSVLTMVMNLTADDAGEIPPGRVIACVAEGEFAEASTRRPHSVIVTLMPG